MLHFVIVPLAPPPAHSLRDDCALAQAATGAAAWKGMMVPMPNSGVASVAPRALLADRIGRWGMVLWRLLDRCSRRRALTCLLLAAFLMSVRLAVLPLVPFPEPFIHDEFSYLLGAETLASGRLTNPTHPMWVHFETFHEIFQPHYMSKFPPGQALFLALGWKLLGHPWYGVWISFGIFAACLCWMLQGWLPPLYALLGSLLAFGQITVFGYWMDSYWGGAVAGIGGCLLLGSLVRFPRRKSALLSAAAACGLCILAISRPFEGLLLAVTAGAAFAWLGRRRGKSLRDLFSMRILVPFAAICGLGACWLGLYNYRNTGSALLMPYVVHDRTYVFGKSFLFLPENPTPVYRHAVMERFWQQDADRSRDQRWFAVRQLKHIFLATRFFASELIVLLVLLAGFLDRGRAARLSLAILGIYGLELLLSTHWRAHYVAGAAGLVLVAAAGGLHLIRRRFGRFGPAVALLCVALAWGQAADEALDGAAAAASNSKSPRTFVAGLVKPYGGRHLILVKYARTHYAGDEYVFNAADIDRSPIVWARDMGLEKNRELLAYYHDRRVWLWQPDVSVSALTPYPDAAATQAGSAHPGPTP